MGLILWPAAMLLFLFWSLAAWLIFGLSDWVASQVAGAVAGVLTAELGPWASWLINGLGTLFKFGVVAVWAIIGLGILGAPLWLRRQRRAGQIPESYARGYPPHGRPHDNRMSDHHVAGEDFDPKPRRRDGYEKPWRDREAWQHRARRSYGEVSFLRDAVGEAMGKYRGKKRKKRDDDDDD